MWGEQLGCASSYTVTLHYQGGQRVYSYPEAVESVEWSRIRRGVSKATVVLSKQSLSSECAALMVDVWPLTHEVTIYRDERAVWQGPIIRRPMVRGQAGQTSITLEAQDAGAWLERRLPHRGVKLSDVGLDEAAREVMRSCFEHQDPNLLRHVSSASFEDQEPASHTIHAYGQWGIDELDDLAEQGMDWTFVGRALHLSPPATVDTQAQAQLTSHDLMGDVELEIDGQEYASLVYAAPQATDGVWEHLEGVGGVSPHFGLVEQVVQTDLSWHVDDEGNWDPPQSPDGEDPLSREETEKALVRAAQERREQVSRPLILVRASEGSRLSPDSPISMDRLVPGVRIDLALDEQDFLFSVVRPMRLTRVDVTWDGSNEQVGVALSQIGTPEDDDAEEIHT